MIESDKHLQCPAVDKLEWLVDATIGEMQQAMVDGSLTAVQLVTWYIERIEAFDRGGFTLNSIAEVNPDALHIARGLDAERERGTARGPLHGIPILLKDSIDTADQMHTTAGSIALANWRPNKDAYLAQRLREAGAILLGKTNMTEWANFMAFKMPAGYSSRGGHTLNPYGPGKIFVGGSSTGSAVAVSANLGAASVGTETSASIIMPAIQNSIVGLKPTVGLISRSGLIPIARSQDTPGPMARTVADVAILLGALTGVDEDDQATSKSDGHAHRDYTKFLDRDGLKGARIGIPRHYYADLDESRKQLAEQAIETLQRNGATIVDPVEIPSATLRGGRQVLRYEFKRDLNDYLAKTGPEVPVHSLQELIQYNLQHEDRALRYGQGILISSEETSGTLRERQYIDSRRRDIEFSTVKGIDYAMQQYKLDALLFPGAKGADMAARAGYPSLTVPCGYAADGVPYGMMFVASAFGEPDIIRIAYAFEQATQHRVPPTMIRS